MEDYPRFRFKQVKQDLYRGLINDWKESTVLPKDLKERLSEELPLAIPAEIVTSEKGDTVKAALSLADDLVVEAVLMKHKDNRNTVCVSSQVGCAMNCSFCATGKMGFKRNLTAGEVVSQVLLFARLLKESEESVNNIVFMGMGEPFLNYDAVMDAIRVLNDSDGFNLGARNFSISTAGIVEGIQKLSNEELQINLAISLHAPENELRSELMPVNRKYPLEDLLRSVSEYTEKTGRQVMFEYLLIKDINDNEDHARKLAEIMQDRLYMVNLISYNPVGDFLPSPSDRIERFKEILEEEGVKVTRRFSFGTDIKGACGQLAREN